MERGVESSERRSGPLRANWLSRQWPWLGKALLGDTEARIDRLRRTVFERTVAAVHAHTKEQMEAQRRYIVGAIPRLLYHYDDLGEEDAVSVALRGIRARVDRILRPTMR